MRIFKTEFLEPPLKHISLMMLNPFTKRSLLLVAAALLGGLAWSHI